MPRGSDLASEIDAEYRRKRYYRCRKCEFFENGKCIESRCVYDKNTKA